MAKETKFRHVYHDDTSVFICGDESSRSKFVYRPFNNKIHPFFLSQLDFITKVLAHKNINLNVIIVPTVDNIGFAHGGEFEEEEVVLTEELYPSDGGQIYILIQDEEIGRGWAILMRYDTETEERHIITQGHRSHVRDFLLEGSWVRSFGIDYQQIPIEDYEE